MAANYSFLSPSSGRTIHILCSRPGAGLFHLPVSLADIQAFAEAPVGKLHLDIQSPHRVYPLRRDLSGDFISKWARDPFPQRAFAPMEHASPEYELIVRAEDRRYPIDK